MDHISNSFRNQIAALTRVINVMRCLKEDNVPCQIEEGLFLGSVGASNNKDALKALNVTHILTVAKSLRPACPNDFVYKVIDVLDREDENIKQYFEECFDFIDEAKRAHGGVLVHCFMGRSRSVTIIVAYLMRKHGMSLSQALEHVKSRRKLAAPNAGFISELEDYEKSLCDAMRFNTYITMTVITICKYHSEASVTESPVPSSSEKPYFVYVLGPKSGFSNSSGSLVARIEKF
ncbi:hypothetical protein FNV43_RR00384 [Rhamnella rubrinervis]|uniref:Dual specificity protein phosphatase 1 n=1 Tax=Rhamnella rubrinervis TaxID=2594499 RepID=A0A8K0HMX9_9ROSA|nr:hypothetical protein FNV43_RR00384 [Rhamnella rubrinervis]